MSAVFGLMVILTAYVLAGPDIKRLVRRKKAKLLKPGVSRSVEIAKNRQWVSPDRLKTEVRTTEWLARVILAEACRQGYLYQAVDGLYYVCRRQRFSREIPDSR